MSPFYIDRTHSIYREHIRYISINVHQNVMMPIGYYLFTWDIFIYMGRHRKSLVTRRPKCHDAHSLFFTWDIIIYMGRLRKSLVTCPLMPTKMSPFCIDRTHSIYREPQVARLSWQTLNHLPPLPPLLALIAPGSCGKLTRCIRIVSRQGRGGGGLLRALGWGCEGLHGNGPVAIEHLARCFVLSSQTS